MGTVSTGHLWIAIRYNMKSAALFRMWRSSNGNILSLMIHLGLVMFLISAFPAAVSDVMKGLFFTPLEKSKPEKKTFPCSKTREIRHEEKRADFSVFSAFPAMADLASVQTVHQTLVVWDQKSHLTLMTLMLLKCCWKVCTMLKSTRADALFLHFQR